jgi:hypothetical protein
MIKQTSGGLSVAGRLRTENDSKKIYRVVRKNLPTINNCVESANDHRSLNTYCKNKTKAIPLIFDVYVMATPYLVE